MILAVAACAFDSVLHLLTACAGADLRRQSLRHRPTLLPMRTNSTLDEAVRLLLTNPGRCRGLRGLAPRSRRSECSGRIPQEATLRLFF